MGERRTYKSLHALQTYHKRKRERNNLEANKLPKIQAIDEIVIRTTQAFMAFMLMFDMR